MERWHGSCQRREIGSWREFGALSESADMHFQGAILDRAGQHLITATNREISKWTISDPALLSAARERANRELRSTEWQETVGGKKPKLPRH